MFLLWTAIFLKHFLCDFPLQTPYQFMNKGKYGHLGGLLHAFLHGVGMSIICSMFGINPIFAGVDTLIHYHIDWLKLNIQTYYNLQPHQSQYWNLFGFDQLLHCMTYVLILWLGGKL